MTEYRQSKVLIRNDYLLLRRWIFKLKYLFWNTHRNNNINDILSELIMENDISIVLLAEYTAEAKELIEMLSSQNVNMTEYGSCDVVS